jgi:hypothetical protein
LGPLITLQRSFAWLSLAATALACSSGEERLVATGGGFNVTQQAPTTETCEDGDARECGVTLNERDGIVTCYAGFQECVGSRWAECGNGTVETKSRPSAAAGGLRAFALGAPTGCVANPCDPGCQVYDENPMIPVQSVGNTPIYNWQNGSLAGFPNGLVKKGLVEPCSTGADCQFNTYCSAPTAGSCSHGVCETGAALDADCSSCTTAVCAADPSCCVAVPGVDTCDHDACARGAALKTGCNSCVTKICAKYPSCCDTKNGTWTAACAAEVVTTCGNSCSCEKGTEINGRCYRYEATTRKWSQAISNCNGLSASGDWDLVGIADAAENGVVRTWGDSNDVWIGLTEQTAYTTANNWVWPSGIPSGTWKESTRTGIYANFAASEPSSTDQCAMMEKATSGIWKGRACSDSYGSVCEGPMEKMVEAAVAPPTWSASCVAKVASVCDATCNPKNAADTSGKCTPWYPGQTDATCAGVDLALGVPCDGVIPVCNHGKTEAPSGIELVHFPANSQQYPALTPDLTHPQATTCTTKAKIPAGECISVTDCTGLNGNKEITVNPTGAVAECSRLDNWTLYSKGASCQAPICAGGSSSASIKKKPIDIIIAIDNSSSMTGEIVQVQNLINTNFADIMAASGIDYRVIMFSRYGDVNIAVGGSDHPICVKKPLGGNDCLAPSIEPLTLNAPRFYHYSADVGSLDSLCMLLGTYNKPDEAATDGRLWTAKAANGWSQWLREDAFKVFMEITDDDASCTSYGYSFKDLGTTAGGTAVAAAFDKELLALSPAQFGTASARNYIWHSIVGLKANSPATTAWPASAAMTTTTCGTGSEGPGTGYQGLSVLTGGLRYPICQNSTFDSIFNAIATEVVTTASASCDYAIDMSMSFDPNLATLIYSTVTKQGADQSTKLTRVANAAACVANAWYYDAASLTVKLCQTTCDTVKADANARVWAEIACPTNVTPTTQTFTYSGLCPSGKGTTWLDLGYTSTIPAGGNVTFRTRVARDTASLSTATWVSLATAVTATQSCPLSSSCDIDVYNKLGSLDAQLPALELEITVTPGTGNQPSSLTGWDLTYTCRDNQ